MKNYTRSTIEKELVGYTVYTTRFADGILRVYFPELITELKGILNEFYIPEEQILASGGGRASMTQRLAHLLEVWDWKKRKIEDEHRVDGSLKTSQTHEIDHYREHANGGVGLEIEWNNKDPFFDRDLENFRKLHNIGAIAVGVIITRSEDLDAAFPGIYQKALGSLDRLDIPLLKEKFDISDKAAKRLKAMLETDGSGMVARVAGAMIQSKFGRATTHMSKLLLRVDRGVGNPCPMLLIGIGPERVSDEKA